MYRDAWSTKHKNYKNTKILICGGGGGGGTQLIVDFCFFFGGGGEGDGGLGTKPL
jgi:hypothetical protein